MLRYSLKFLFALTAVTAFGCAVLYTMPQTVATTAATVFSVVVIPALMAGAVYCIGYTRAFCFGALFPIVQLWVLVLWENQFATNLLLALLDVYAEDNSLERAAAFSFTCGILLCGAGGVVMRWIGQRQRQQPQPQPRFAPARGAA